ncbi:MAG TPA: rhomboid family intramembrane serine protease [Vicinamibacterales bacterium]|nr:rhomboid family intramembrane serine protease [Vicinamibacterales bacterium]
MARENAPITALLAALVVAAYGLELGFGGMAACDEYGLVPVRWSVGTALSSMFLHDPTGWAHLGGNLVFLVVFGAIVEQALGSLGFAALYALAGLGGAAMHCLVNPSSTDPLVGCSGALFGLMAVAAVLRPRMLGFVVAYMGLNVWYAIMGGAGNVSFGCHIGGFAVGFLAVVALRAVDSETLEAA